MISDIINQVRLLQGSALLAIDIQNDFLPGGNFAVPNGDKIIPVMNAYIQKFHSQKLPIYASRDWLLIIIHLVTRESNGRNIVARAQVMQSFIQN